MQRWGEFCAATPHARGRWARQRCRYCKHTLVTVLRAGGAHVSLTTATHSLSQQNAACQAGARPLTGVLLLLHDSRAVQGRAHFNGGCGRLAACHAVVLVAC